MLSEYWNQYTIEAVMLMSLWGGVIKCISPNRKVFSLKRVFYQIIKSCFIGLIIALICIDNKVSPTMTIVYCGIAGNMSDALMTLMREKLRHILVPGKKN